MRVVFAANWWYRRGGLGSVMMDEALYLGSLGHQVIPFASAHPDNEASPFSQYFPPFRETAHAARSLGFVDRARLALDLAWNRDAQRRFAALLDATRPDLVHLHNTARQLSPVVVREARRRGLPVVMTLHDYGLICPQGLLYRGGKIACNPPNCLRGNVLHCISNVCVHGSVVASTVAAFEHALHGALGSYTRGVSLFLSPSQYLSDTILHGTNLHIAVQHLPNGIDPGPPPAQLPMTDGHILFQGRLVAEKGVVGLLAVARSLRQASLVIAGDGPLRGDLEREAPSNVRIVGNQTPDKLRSLLDRSVAVVAPSTWFENAPLAVIEAMRGARPVIATNIGGHSELLSGGGGILVPSGDLEALTGAVDALWSDRQRAAAIGAAGRAAFLDRYTLERHMNGLMRAYASVLPPADSAR